MVLINIAAQRGDVGCGFIAGLVAQGALLGGKCWANPDLNAAASIQNGQVCFYFDFTPPFPAALAFMSG